MWCDEDVNRRAAVQGVRMQGITTQSGIAARDHRRWHLYAQGVRHKRRHDVASRRTRCTAVIVSCRGSGPHALQRPRQNSQTAMHTGVPEEGQTCWQKPLRWHVTQDSHMFSAVGRQATRRGNPKANGSLGVCGNMGTLCSKNPDFEQMAFVRYVAGAAESTWEAFAR